MVNEKQLDLISRKTVQERIEKTYGRLIANLNRADLAAAIMTVGDYINEAPTVDAVEVVRCKDCAKAVRHEIFPHSRRCKVEDCRFSHKETHFCSYGERREEE